MLHIHQGLYLQKIVTKTGISKNNVISYRTGTNKGKERGFLSFEGALAPASLFLKLYFENKSKDNIEEELRKYGVEDALIKEFLAALNDCEFARFAPGDDNQAMDKVYSASLAVISKMENSIKH